MSRELLPCPFCGGEAKNVSGMYAGPSEWLHEGDEIFAVNCSKCGAGVPNRYRNELVIESWNRRALPAPASAEPFAWWCECHGFMGRRGYCGKDEPVYRGAAPSPAPAEPVGWLNPDGTFHRVSGKNHNYHGACYAAPAEVVQRIRWEALEEAADHLEHKCGQPWWATELRRLAGEGK